MVNMRGILFLCLCVCISTGEELLNDDYIQYLESLENNTDFISEYLTFEPLAVDDLRRHYVIFVGVITSWVEYLNLCDPLEYDDGYLPILDKMVPVYWQEPQMAVEKFKNISERVETMMKPVKENIAKRCEGLQKETCNTILRIAAPEMLLEPALAVLALTNTMEKEFLKIESELIVAVSEYNEISLLIKGHKQFRPLVELASQLFKSVFNSDVCVIDVDES